MNHYDDFYEIIFDRLMESEFNFNNSPQERKHWTGGAVGRGELKGSKYGISAMSYPDQDIINLTKEQAMEIYYCDFYSPFKDEFSIPQCVMFQFLDSVIEHGIHHSVVFLQNALKVKPDGILGSVTIGAMKDAIPHEFVLHFIAERLDFISNYSSGKIHSQKWQERTSRNVKYAVADLKNI
ncbi:hypothetical protein DSB67_25390 (plasmid) [Vibrio campbellii]|uniref:hypothetical protein n=1 Tax=Vibrio campbellii TaxID=680 RepID=UPI00026C4B45|nr:hypothetical protein [Vibrio campbellii]AXB34740.1 hypothetical protein DSB67_25390 [Vibrio campbellii]